MGGRRRRAGGGRVVESIALEEPRGLLFRVVLVEKVEICPENVDDRPREGVMVTLLLRLGLWRKTFSGRRVAASLPSCVAVPSRRSCTKYGPHLRATMRELIGTRSPLTQRMSMSDNSRSPRTIWPRSSAAFENERPPAVQPPLVPKLNEGTENGELAETKPDIGAAFLGLS